MKLAHKEYIVRGLLIMIMIAVFTYVGVRNSPDNVRHPDNSEFVLEIAFNEQIAPEQVTQKQFNARYGTVLRTITFKK